jgi:hypothetical protein
VASRQLATKAVIVALIAWRLLSSPRKLHDASRTLRNSTKKRSKVPLNEPAFFVIAALLLFLLGFFTFPSSDPRPAFHERFEIIVDPLPRDAYGDLAVRSLIWNESHRFSLDKSGGRVPLEDSAAPRIIGTFDIRLARKLSASSVFVMKVKVSNRAFRIGCGSFTPSGANATCDHVEEPAESECNKGPGSPICEEWRLFSIFLSIPPDEDHITGFIEFGGVDGIAFIGNETYEVDRRPFVRTGGANEKPVEVATIASIPKIAELSWQEPPTTGSDIAVGWKSDNSSFPPPPTTGIRQAVVEENADRLFFAGLILGTGGAALIAAAQAMFARCKSLGRATVADTKAE